MKRRHRDRKLEHLLEMRCIDVWKELCSAASANGMPVQSGWTADFTIFRDAVGLPPSVRARLVHLNAGRGYTSDNLGWIDE